jgi:hypothetical protein
VGVSERVNSVGSTAPVPAAPPPSNRPVWLAIIILTAVIAAAASGLLLHLAKATPAASLVGSGAAFVATMTLGMAASRFLSD